MPERMHIEEREMTQLILQDRISRELFKSPMLRQMEDRYPTITQPIIDHLTSKVREHEELAGNALDDEQLNGFISDAISNRSKELVDIVRQTRLNGHSVLDLVTNPPISDGGGADQRP